MERILRSRVIVEICFYRAFIGRKNKDLAPANSFHATKSDDVDRMDWPTFGAITKLSAQTILSCLLTGTLGLTRALSELCDFLGVQPSQE
jgi:hypothetical protein